MKFLQRGRAYGAANPRPSVKRPLSGLIRFERPASTFGGWFRLVSMGNRQMNGDGRAAADPGLNADIAAMRFHDSADNRQTQAGALGFRRGEHCGERLSLHLTGHPFAGILEFQSHMRRFVGLRRRCTNLL